MTKPTTKILSRRIVAAAATLAIAIPAAAQETIKAFASADATVNGGAADNNFGGAPTLVTSTGTNEQEAFILFNTLAIPTNAKVTAVRWSYAIEAESQGTVTIHPVFAKWSERTITFKNRPRSGNVLKTDPSTALGLRKFNAPELVRLVQAWVEDPDQNFGIVLKQRVSSLRRFTSIVSNQGARSANQRPQLEIDFTAPVGTMRLENGAPDLAGEAFDSANPGRIVALVPRLVNNTGAVADLQKLRLFLAGSGDNVTQLDRVSVFLDKNEDGLVSAGETEIATAIPTEDDAVIELRTTLEMLKDESLQLLVVLEPSNNCPAGVEFAAAIRDDGVDAVARGTKVQVLGSFVQGPEMFCETQKDLDGDANGDGRIDCLDMQILGRAIGSAPNDLPDPDANDIINTTDVRILRDRVLRRPTISRIEFDGAGESLVTVSGIDLGIGVDQLKVLLNNGQVDLQFSSARTKAFRTNLRRGQNVLQIIVDGRPSSVREFRVE